ncbi:MAG: DUF6316 family protein [Halioglobus sp.]
MSDKRRGDLKSQSWFRSSRFFRNDGKWYFNTREGTAQGPFWELKQAENRLEDYIKVTTSGFMPSDSKLDLEPLGLDD